MGETLLLYVEFRLASFSNEKPQDASRDLLYLNKDDHIHLAYALHGQLHRYSYPQKAHQAVIEHLLLQNLSFQFGGRPNSETTRFGNFLEEEGVILPLQSLILSLKNHCLECPLWLTLR